MVRIISSANPNGSYLKHNGDFDPSFTAQFNNKTGWNIPVTNQVRKGGICHEDGQESALKSAKSILTKEQKLILEAE